MTFITYIPLGTWDTCRSKHLLLGCICSPVWWGVWWGALFPEYKLEYCAAPGDISDRFAAPRLYPHCTLGAGRRSPLSHVHQQLSPRAITARVHRVPVTRLPAQQWLKVKVDFALALIFYWYFILWSSVTLSLRAWHHLYLIRRTICLCVLWDEFNQSSSRDKTK